MKPVNLNAASKTELSESGLLNEKDADGLINIRGPDGQLSMDKLLAATSFTEELMQRWISGGQVLAVFTDWVPPQGHSPTTGRSSAESTEPDVRLENPEIGATGDDCEKPPAGHDLELEPNRRMDVDDGAGYPPERPPREERSTREYRRMHTSRSSKQRYNGYRSRERDWGRGPSQDQQYMDFRGGWFSEPYDDDYNMGPMGFHSGMEQHYDSMWRPSPVLPTHMLRTMRQAQEAAQRAFMACLHGYGGLGGPTGWRGDQYGGPPGLPYGHQDMQSALMDGWMPAPTRNAAAPHSYYRRDTVHEEPGRWRIDGSDRDRESVEQFRPREETWVKGPHRDLSGRSQPAEENDTRYFRFDRDRGLITQTATEQEEEQHRATQYHQELSHVGAYRTGGGLSSHEGGRSQAERVPSGHQGRATHDLDDNMENHPSWEAGYRQRQSYPMNISRPINAAPHRETHDTTVQRGYPRTQPQLGRRAGRGFEPRAAPPQLQTYPDSNSTGMRDRRHRPGATPSGSARNQRSSSRQRQDSLSRDGGARSGRRQHQTPRRSSSSSSSSSERSRSSDDQHRRRAHRSRTSKGRCWSSSEDTESEEDRGYQRQRRPHSSQAPKMQTFGGKPGEWESFIFHFKRVASFNHWSDKEKRDQLLACLRGKAVSFIQSKSKRTCQSYDGLKKTLDDRYGVQELPSTARRQLGSIRQEENESIEEFADRVLVKAMEAFPDVKSRVLQEMATDSFLRGCRDKYAAYAASEKKPENLHQAIQEVRDSITNLRVFGRVGLSTRQVTFESDVEETGKAKLAKLTPEQEAAVKFIADALSKSSLNVNDYRVDRSRRSSTPPADRRPRSRSSSPGGGHCYAWGEPGHFARDCTKPSTCFKCSRSGHLARNCPSDSNSTNTTGMAVTPSPVKSSLKDGEQELNY